MTNFMQLHVKANDGIVWAQYQLGEVFFYGVGVPKNLDAADKWLTLAAKSNEKKYRDAAQSLLVRLNEERAITANKTTAAERTSSFAPNSKAGNAKASNTDDAEAIYRLGRNLYFGLDNVKINYPAAFEQFSLGHRKGNALCTYRLGVCYDSGKGVERNEQKARGYFVEAFADIERLARGGNVDAQHCYANYYNFALGNVAENQRLAFEWYTKAAEQGNAVAQYNLGLRYDNGEGVAQDYNKAIYWYTKSAEQGYAVAQCNLGLCYLRGEGVAQDYNKAIYWGTKAAEQGHAEAQYFVGIYYVSNTTVVTKDYAKAVYWLTKAAEQGHAKAQASLGLRYDNGEGVAQDYNKAIYWYTKAAEQGNMMAQNNLGRFYKTGKGVTKDYVKAVYWYTKAAEQGYEVAQYNLGSCYDNGEGVTKDYNKAVHWYTKSAEQGYADAQYNLGILYYNAMYGMRSGNKAMKWFQLAADQNHEKAKEKVQQLRYEGVWARDDVKKIMNQANNGDAEAQYKLNLCYSLGLGGIDVNEELARQMLEKAAAQGHKLAKQELETANRIFQ